MTTNFNAEAGKTLFYSTVQV